MRLVLGMGVWVASVGWLVPLMLSASMVWTWLTTEVTPVIYGGQGQVNSFPLLHTGQELFWSAFLWFGLVVLGWSAFIVKLATDSQVQNAELRSGHCSALDASSEQL